MNHIVNERLDKAGMRSAGAAAPDIPELAAALAEMNALIDGCWCQMSRLSNAIDRLGGCTPNVESDAAVPAQPSCAMESVHRLAGGLNHLRSVLEAESDRLTKIV